MFSWLARLSGMVTWPSTAKALSLAGTVWLRMLASSRLLTSAHLFSPLSSLPFSHPRIHPLGRVVSHREGVSAASLCRFHDLLRSTFASLSSWPWLLPGSPSFLALLRCISRCKDGLHRCKQSLARAVPPTSPAHPHAALPRQWGSVGSIPY